MIGICDQEQDPWGNKWVNESGHKMYGYDPETNKPLYDDGSYWEGEQFKKDLEEVKRQACMLYQLPQNYFEG